MGRGCESHPAYAASRKRDGVIRAFAFREVSRLGARLFCAQPITPVVEIYDTTGHFLGVSRRAPPFYRTPVDQPEGTNAKKLLQYQSTWTDHVKFFPMRDGFVSVYASYDTTAKRIAYMLFECDSTIVPVHRVRCGDAAVTGEPVGLVRPDTLLIIQRDTGPGPVSLVRFLITHRG